MDEGGRIGALVRDCGNTVVATNNLNNMGASKEVDGDSLVGATSEQFELHGCLGCELTFESEWG